MKAIATKEVRDRVTGAGYEPKSSTPEELGAHITGEVARWGRIIKDSGIRVE